MYIRSKNALSKYLSISITISISLHGAQIVTSPPLHFFERNLHNITQHIFKMEKLDGLRFTLALEFARSETI